MSDLTVQDWIAVVGVALGIVLAALNALCKAMKWDKGLIFLDEFRAALPWVKKYFDLAAADGFQAKHYNLEKAANQIAMRVPGVTGAEMLGVAEKLFADKTANYGGLRLSVDATGVSVDPSGLVAAKSRKLGKFLKKLF